MGQAEKFSERRARLIELMEGDYCIVIKASSSKPTSADGMYPYTPSRNLYYLTGIDQENSCLMMWRLTGREAKECLYISPYDEAFAKWYGTVLTKEQAKENSGIEDIRFTGGEDKFLDKLVSRERLGKFYFDWHNCGVNGTPGKRLQYVNNFRSVYPGESIQSISDKIFSLRMIKDEAELETMREAIQLTRKGFEAAAKKLAPGMNEREFEAELLYEWAKEGEKASAFSAIVAGGSRATCLHYVSNDTDLSDGELLLVDHGAMKNLYCADITRTIPVNGKYTARQRELMEMVLEIQAKAIELLRPGKLHREWNDEVLEAYKEIMLSRGEIKEPEGISNFYYHGIGHHIGLDTHDENVSSLPIAPGMVFTVEPGFYSAEEGIGIRIEDNVLVGETENTILSAGFPKTPDEIEALMANK
ncbi:MAG: aminopeptidase P N-terminal domain-containing protein [Candidatus Sabulitectum sp.]|nr:aminopeptidase P N-terminal domain-containing protein [Candidatus Sabulitectum sp.]